MPPRPQELQSELVVLKAISAREEAVSKLYMVVEKIEDAARGPVAILSPKDPLGSLFYRRGSQATGYDGLLLCWHGCLVATAVVGLDRAADRRSCSCTLHSAQVVDTTAAML